MKEKEPIERDDSTKSQTGTRDAVETSIEFAKQDKDLSWDEQIAKNPGRITPWQEASQVIEK